MEGDVVPVDKIRNIAIIAHVDHGKTTLVDKLLAAGMSLKEDAERVMDCNVLEVERGITILAKSTSIRWGDYKINIVDTPGHGDFGGEVERVMSMVDGVVLLVDGTEGPMAQTKFVLSKALKRGVRVIVVMNKMDRPTARPKDVENDIFELFMVLEATEKQLEYPTFFASAREGWVTSDQEKMSKGELPRDMSCLLNAIVEHVDHPQVNSTGPFKMLVTTLGSDQFFGRILTGRVSSGTAKINDRLKAINRNGQEIEIASISRIMGRRGMEPVVLKEGLAGDIVSLSGFSKATATDTICSSDVSEPIKADPIDPPVISMVFGVNKSPLGGKEGKFVTSAQIQARLFRELESNVTLQMELTSDEGFEVKGRGELQLGILIENMRREGFELSVSPPRVVYKFINDKRHEPMEEVVIDIDSIYSGMVIDRLSRRKGMLIDVKETGDKTRLVFHLTSRGLLGFRSELISATRGTGVLNHIFLEYVPFQGELDYGRKGVIVSCAAGSATGYALKSIESRGVLFIEPGTDVYEGMVIGESSREDDVDVNPVKAKHLTNVRSVIKEEFFRLSTPRKITLEEAITYILNDELLEVTPQSIRIRKKILNSDMRMKASKRNTSEF